MAYRKILIAIDNGKNSLVAARQGLLLAQRLGAETAFVSVVDTGMAIGNPDTGVSFQDILAELKKESEQALEKAEKLTDFSGIKEFIPEGNPKEQILKVAKDWGAELIILGRDEHGALFHTLVGSLCEHIVRHSPVPVMVIPAEHPAK